MDEMEAQNQDNQDQAGDKTDLEQDWKGLNRLLFSLSTSITALSPGSENRTGIPDVVSGLKSDLLSHEVPFFFCISV